MNTRKLKGKMAEMEYTQERLAKKIGIGATSFGARLSGKKELLRREVVELKKLLRLNEREFIDVFFEEVKD